MKRIQRLTPLACACILLLASSCSPKMDNKGYTAETQWKDQVIAGKTTKDQVQAMFGSPSSQSTFGDDAWYYISARKESYLFMKPDIVDQNVVRIEFDPSGVVSSMQIYDKNSAQQFAMESRTTPTEGHTYGFFEQLLGNIGRFNKPTDASDTSAPGRKPSP